MPAFKDHAADRRFQQMFADADGTEHPVWAEYAVRGRARVIRKKQPPEDKRPLWRRLLSAVRPDIRFSKKIISYIGIKGRIEF